jgi:hypothetical protein
MKQGWIVVREEKHVDPKFWVCTDKADALAIAADVTAYWREKNQPDPENVDEELYEDMAFHYDAEDCFRVYVQPQDIRDPGETAPSGRR